MNARETGPVYINMRAIVLLVMGAVGCGGAAVAETVEASRLDAGGAVDARPDVVVVDARTDALTVDTGASVDSGTVEDAGTTDTGTPVDDAGVDAAPEASTACTVTSDNCGGRCRFAGPSTYCGGQWLQWDYVCPSDCLVPPCDPCRIGYETDSGGVGADGGHWDTGETIWCCASM